LSLEWRLFHCMTGVMVNLWADFCKMCSDGLLNGTTSPKWKWQ
jgi:hypothetical protein